MNTDAIAAALSLFFAPDDVFEVRALDHGGPGKKSAGWFKGSMAERAAAKIAEAAADSWGVYFTPNPSSRDCYRRCAGMLRPAFFPLTADADVPARRWLIIDVDPIRPAEFKKDSVTDAEKAAAGKVADQVREFLAARHWPAPLVVDSGNGVHLYYRLHEEQAGGHADSAADPLAMLLRCLKSRFDTTAAEIDPSVYNPSRIMKVPGTWSRKGADSSERPHRQSAILEAPETWRAADEGSNIGPAA